MLHKRLFYYVKISTKLSLFFHEFILYLLIFNCCTLLLCTCCQHVLCNFKKYFIYLHLEKWEGKERDGEKYQCVIACCTCLLLGMDLARNPGMCPDWESNMATLCFAGPSSKNLATPARAVLCNF